MPRTPSKERLAGLTFVFVWFFIGGIAHFAKTDLEVSIMPPYVPWPRAAVLVSGVFELWGAFGILYGPTRRVAGIGLLALTTAVTPANLYMAQHPDQFHIAEWILIARLPLQLALLALIDWSTSAWIWRPKPPATPTQ